MLECDGCVNWIVTERRECIYCSETYETETY